MLHSSVGLLGVTLKMEALWTSETKLRNEVRELEWSASSFSFHFILNQEMLCAKSLKMGHIMDTSCNCEYYLCRWPYPSWVSRITGSNRMRTQQNNSTYCQIFKL